jgi:ERCC4-type nuclease
MIVETRERQAHPQVHQHLVVSLGADTVETESMRFGDYAFYGAPINEKSPHIGIEYATLNDLLGKIQTGRFQQQLIGCMETYDITILLVEGIIQEDKDSGRVRTYGYDSKMDYARLREVLFSAKAHGIIVEDNNLNRKKASERLVQIFRYYRKDQEKHKLFRRTEAGEMLIPIAAEVERPVSVIMSSVKGVGLDLALAALNHAHTIEMLTTMREPQLQKIPGWGPKLSKDYRATVTKWFDG